MDEVNTPARPAVSRRKPVVTYTLAAICASVYLLEMLLGADSNTFIWALMGAKVNAWIAARVYVTTGLRRETAGRAGVFTSSIPNKILIDYFTLKAALQSPQRCV